MCYMCCLLCIMMYVILTHTRAYMYINHINHIRYDVLNHMMCILYDVLCIMCYLLIMCCVSCSMHYLLCIVLAHCICPINLFPIYNNIESYIKLNRTSTLSLYKYKKIIYFSLSLFLPSFLPSLLAFFLSFLLACFLSQLVKHTWPKNRAQALNSTFQPSSMGCCEECGRAPHRGPFLSTECWECR